MVGVATGTTGTYKEHNNSTIPTIDVMKSGYIYVWVSNESKYDVFFDNLQLIHNRGPILEETHYYPFGLTMTGISSKALNGVAENKTKYNAYENNTDFNLNLNESFFRIHDPQIGRFWQTDTRPNEMLSLYASMANNPILFADPLGDTVARFNRDGTFLEFYDDGKETWTWSIGQNNKKGNWKSSNSGTFNDPEVDVLAIKNFVNSGGEVGIGRITIMSDEAVEKQIERSGVKNSKRTDAEALKYAKDEGAGKMDYGVNGIIAGDFDTKSFYVREGTAYNVGDIGNYLWGRGMAELWIPLSVARLGAHVNNAVNGRRQGTSYYDFGPGTYGSPGILDSKGDQRAIRAGYLNSPAGQRNLNFWKQQAEEAKRLRIDVELKYPTGPKF